MAIHPVVDSLLAAALAQVARRCCSGSPTRGAFEAGLLGKPEFGEKRKDPLVYLGKWMMVPVAGACLVLDAIQLEEILKIQPPVA